VTKKGSDVAYDLAEFTRQLRFEDVPDVAIAAAKDLVIDAIGVAAAGVTAPGLPELISLVNADYGKGSSRVLFHDLQLPPQEAALLNSALIHAQDFDDIHDKAHIHVMSVILPAALAAAEVAGNVTGRELITSVVAGVEVASRLALAPEAPRRGWHYTPLCGGFGAVATVSRLWGFREEQTRNAWGLMYSRTSGNLQAELDNALSKRMQPGFSAESAVLSARMAAAGITGADSTFEGPAGYFNLYQTGKYNRETITDAFGHSFQVTEVSIKPYPCCRLTHPAIDAALQIRKDKRFAPEAVKYIEARVSSQAMYEVCLPKEHKKNPRGIVDAQFSLPYTVAVALQKGGVGLSDFTAETLGNTGIIELARKVECHVDSKIEEESGGAIAACELRTHLKNGDELRYKVSSPKGSPNNPMSREQVREKILQCADLYVSPPSREELGKIHDRFSRLEGVVDVCKILPNY